MIRAGVGAPFSTNVRPAPRVEIVPAAQILYDITKTGGARVSHRRASGPGEERRDTEKLEVVRRDDAPNQLFSALVCR